MNLHALTFSIIMIAIGLWQFRRAGQIANFNTEIDAAKPQDRRAYDALGYAPTRPKYIRLTGSLMILAGVAAAVAPMLGQK